jgi:hypothetical protein
MSVAFSQNLKGQVVDICAAREGFIVTAVSREAIRKARAGGDPTNLHLVRPKVYENVKIVKS